MPSRKSKTRTIADVEKAGFRVALASGSVEREEEALAAARSQAAPEAIQSDVDQVASEVARATKVAGLAESQRVEIVTRAATNALRTITKARDETVAFHERALDAAKAMPDVYVVTALGDPASPDDDVRVYVSCKPDGSGWDAAAQELLDALCASR